MRERRWKGPEASWTKHAKAHFLCCKDAAPPCIAVRCRYTKSPTKNPQETFGSSSTPRGAPQKETNMWTIWLMEVAPQWLRNSRNKRHAERNEYERDQKETEWKGLINDEQKTEQKKHELMARSVQNMMPTDRSAGPSLPAPLSAPCRLSNLINRMRKRTITTHHSKTFNHFQTNLSTHLTSK